MKRIFPIILCIAAFVLFPRIHRFWYNRRPAEVVFSDAANSIGVIEDWMRTRVDTELAPHTAPPDLDAIMALDLPLIRVTISNNKLSCAPDLSGDVRFDAIYNGLSSLLKLTTIADCEFALCLGDTVEWNSKEIAPPIFVFGRETSEQGLILFPDFSCFSDRCGQYAWITHVAPEVRAANDKIPWEMKRNISIWRGAATGLGDHPFTSPRCNLVSLSKQHPKQIDAGFTHFAQAPTSIRKQLGSKNFLSPADQIAYKYLICLDGNTTTYPGMHWRLLSNSLVFKHDSVNIQWYYDALIPYTHYIPIANDCSNLKTQLDWAEQHDQIARQIARNATEFAENNLSLPAIFAYTAHLLNTYAQKLQKPPGSEGSRDNLGPKRESIPIDTPNPNKIIQVKR